jgi:hypothetical protein
MNQKELCDNINLLPIRFNIPKDEINSIELFIDITNNTDDVLTVQAGDMKTKGYKLQSQLFFPSTVLIYLNPGKRLSVNNIRVVKGNTETHAKFLIAPQSAIWPLDRKPDDTTINSNHIKHEITFMVNVVSKSEKDIAKTIINNGCSNLIARLRFILDIVDRDDSLFVEKYREKYIVRVEETNCIGKLIERIGITIYPKIQYIGAELLYHTKICTITITGSDSRKMLLNIIKTGIKLYESLQI